MTRLYFLLFLTLIIINTDCTTRIGHIKNVTYIPPTIADSFLYNITYVECICYAFFSSTYQQYIGLNWYQYANMCVLYANYPSSSSYVIQANINSTFAFIQLPPLQVITMVSESGQATTQKNTDYSTLVSTTPTCVNTIIPAGRAPFIAWDFEGNTNDRFLVYNGTQPKNQTYQLGRNGCSRCLNLTGSLNQSVFVYRTPYIDLRNLSFSVESWIKPTIVTDGLEHVILSQCGSLGSYCCMRAAIGSPGPMTFRFRSDTLTGIRNVSINVWSHVAYVYEATTRTMSVYLNGTFEISNSGHGPYLGPPTFFEIGNVNLIGGIYYSGCIDEIFFYRFARTSSEIAATFALG